MTALSPEEHRNAAIGLLAQVTWWSGEPDGVRIGEDALPYLVAAQVHATLAGVTPGPQLPRVDIADSVVAEYAEGRLFVVEPGPGLTVVLGGLDTRCLFDRPHDLRRLAAALLGHADRIERGTT